MRSWKTTAAAAVSAASSFVMFAQFGGYMLLPRWALGMAMFAHVGGLTAFGIAAKDYNVSGQDSPPSQDKATK
jgi:small neutral amino acid transporter SnatA (MarC family)